MSKRVCVIGAGMSGLCTIKELLEQGHQVTCYEANSDLGGAFTIAYDSLLLTVSNYFMAYSAFPPSLEEERRYWNKSEYLSYLDRYSQAFDLLPHIRFSHRVMRVEPKDSGFQVGFKSAHESASAFFDAIAVCSGSHNTPKIPKFKGLETFTGEIQHSMFYKNADAFAGKRVVCIGGGESGAEITHEISNVAKSCTLSIRKYPSMVQRFVGQHTGDALTANAFYAMGKDGLNAFMHSKAAWHLKQGLDLAPEQLVYFEWVTKCDGFLDQFLVKNDAYMRDIAEGHLAFNVGGIERLEDRRVIFRDGSVVEADVLMCNTGYCKELDFLAPWFQLSNARDLFKHSIHPDWGERLAFIGLARATQGGVPACSEMQARYWALLLAGKRQLPLRAQLQTLIEQDRNWEERFFSKSPEIKSLVSYPTYMRAYAELIGCQPHWWSHLDLGLWHKLWFGSHIPQFYRLRGPGAMKDEAVKVIKCLPIAFGWQRILIMLFYTLFFRVKSISNWLKFFLERKISGIEEIRT